MATLLPWNFFITPFAYWMTKLQRSDWQNHTTTVPELSTTPVTIANVSVQVNASIDGKGTFQIETYAFQVNRSYEPTVPYDFTETLKKKFECGSKIQIQANAS